MAATLGLGADYEGTMTVSLCMCLCVCVVSLRKALFLLQEHLPTVTQSACVML